MSQQQPIEIPAEENGADKAKSATASPVKEAGKQVAPPPEPTLPQPEEDSTRDSADSAEVVDDEEGGDDEGEETNGEDSQPAVAPNTDNGAKNGKHAAEATESQANGDAAAKSRKRPSDGANGGGQEADSGLENNGEDSNSQQSPAKKKGKADESAPAENAADEAPVATAGGSD